MISLTSVSAQVQQILISIVHITYRHISRVALAIIYPFGRCALLIITSNRLATTHRAHELQIIQRTAIDSDELRLMQFPSWFNRFDVRRIDCKHSAIVICQPSHTREVQPFRRTWHISIDIIAILIFEINWVFSGSLNLQCVNLQYLRIVSYEYRAICRIIHTDISYLLHAFHRHTIDCT